MPMPPAARSIHILQFAICNARYRGLLPRVRPPGGGTAVDGSVVGCVSGKIAGPESGVTVGWRLKSIAGSVVGSSDGNVVGIDPAGCVAAPGSRPAGGGNICCWVVAPGG